MARNIRTSLGHPFLIALAASLFGTVGCGADFDSPDEVKTLRVLAVQKDRPYAAPTTDPANPSEVHLTMLSHDGAPLDSSAASNTINRFWFSGCDSLPGDQYFSCLARIYFMWQIAGTAANALPVGGYISLAQIAKDLPPGVPNLEDLARQLQLDLPSNELEAYFDTYRIGRGERFTYPIPPRIIENHRAKTASGVPPYGVSFIFFTACRGTLSIAPEWQKLNLGVDTQLTDAVLGFPLICTGQDRYGQPITYDSDDYIAGYTQQFVYGDGLSDNSNPVIDAIRFNSSEVTNPAAVCRDGDCVPERQITSGDCEADAANSVRQWPHVPACSSHCPEYQFLPEMDAKKNDEADTFTSKSQGSDVSEQMWISYYSDRGELHGSGKALRDPTLGWFDDHGQKWKAPADAGPARLWAVVHDNRGGTAWAGLQVCVDAAK